jgi:hypothetical protein
MYKENTNIFIRGLYSPGYSSLIISFFKGNLVFKFVPYVGKDARGFSRYSKETFLSTSINYGGASYFLLTAMSILYGEEADRQLVAEYPCSNGATLTLENKPDENNQMRAYLVINKNKVTIPFSFDIQPYKLMVDGRMVPRIHQSGLGVFAFALEGYLRSTGINAHLSKLPDYILDDTLEPPTAATNSGYQTM